MIRAGYVAKRDMEIPLSEGKNLSVKAGQLYLLNTSRRDTKAQIKQMIKQS
ncbi:MAG: hypothetical protein LBO09_07410 [Candidatus Peribacteria bacterium]|jgi:hypothetical protein|nr:hypothetical protein [Candidatus Peribacteria bacterium]